MSAARKLYVAPAIVEEFTRVDEKNPFFLRCDRDGVHVVCLRCATIVESNDIDGRRLDAHAARCEGTFLAEARAAARGAS